MYKAAATHLPNYLYSTFDKYFDMRNSYLFCSYNYVELELENQIFQVK